MATTWILAFSILLQLTAAVLALRLNWIYGKQWAWTFISAAIVLMTVRRGITLYDVITGQAPAPPSLAVELTALFISLFMVAGISLVHPIFRALARAEEVRRGETRELSSLIEQRAADLQTETAERRRIETALRNEEAFYSSLVETLPMCILRKDLDGRFTFANRKYLEVSGKRREEVIGKTDFDLYPPELAEKYRRDDLHVIQTGQLYEDVEKNENGPSHWVQVLKTPVRDAAGQIVGIQAIFWDVTDRKRVEEALRESAARRKAIFEGSLDCMILMDHEGKIIEFNRAAEKTFGYRADEVLGKDMDPLLFPPSSRGRPRDNLDRYESRREEGSMLGRRLEITAQRKSGEQFTAEMALQPIPLEGQPVFAIFLRDITDRKEAERALRRSDARFRRLVNSNIIGLMITDFSGKISEANEAFLAMIGYTRGDLKAGRVRWNEITPPEYRPLDERAVAELQKSGTCPPWEKEYIRKDGSRVPVLVGVVMLEESSESCMAFILDMTPLKRVEEALRESERRTRLIVDTALDAFVAMDVGGVIIDWNAQAKKTFGWTREEALGRVLADTLVPHRFRDAHRAGIERFLASGEGPVLNRRIELTALHRDGREFPVELTISPIRLHHTYIFNAFVHDITARKRAQQELQAAKEAAEAASRAKSDFLANMSHEIRTPMNAILGMTELVLDTKLSPSQRDYLVMVRESGESLLSLLNDILDFSKIEAGRLDLERTVFSPHESLGDMMKSLAVRAHAQGLELAFHVAPNVPKALVGDPARLRQIIVNLVGNAVKFTERGEVVLDVEPAALENGEVELHFTVTDTGIGIPPGKISTIFEAFEQADTSTTRKYGGTGLGLTISSRLVELMGGRIWAESQVGAGSRFHFTARFGVPQHDNALPKAGVQPLSPQQAVRLRGLRVLVVDDNATNRFILAEILGNWGMVPITISNAHDALDVLREANEAGNQFPLVLTDVNMPEKDGFVLAEQIKRDRHLGSTVIMMLTSGDRPGDIVRCENVGAAAYLVKPVKQSELFDAIVSALGIRLAEDQDEAAAADQQMPRLGPLSVLLAEDSVVNQRLAVGLLEKWGHSVTVVNNGEEALAALEAHTFDLVLMDIQMPEMDGLEAATAIRQRERGAGAHVPIIAMTAHAMKGDRERCLQAGMDGYVAKPVRARQLLETIETVLCGPRQRFS